MGELSTDVRDRPVSEDKTLALRCSNVSFANCGSSLIVIVYFETNEVKTTTASISENLYLCVQRKRNNQMNRLRMSRLTDGQDMHEHLEGNNAYHNVKRKRYAKNSKHTATERNKSFAGPFRLKEARGLESLRVGPIPSYTRSS